MSDDTVANWHDIQSQVRILIFISFHLAVGWWLAILLFMYYINFDNLDILVLGQSSSPEA